MCTRQHLHEVPSPISSSLGIYVFRRKSFNKKVM
jgi:hypothetical protein